MFIINLILLKLLMLLRWAVLLLPIVTLNFCCYYCTACGKVWNYCLLPDNHENRWYLCPEKYEGGTGHRSKINRNLSQFLLWTTRSWYSGSTPDGEIEKHIFLTSRFNRASMSACLDLILLAGIHICYVKKENLVTQKPGFISEDMCVQFCENECENIPRYRLKWHSGPQCLHWCANTLTSSK